MLKPITNEEFANSVVAHLEENAKDNKDLPESELNSIAMNMALLEQINILREEINNLHNRIADISELNNLTTEV